MNTPAQCRIMRLLAITLFLTASVLTHTAKSAKILGVFHVAAYSHYKLSDTILKELASRGHEVTVITPYAEKKPIKNFKQVILTGVLEKSEGKSCFALFCIRDIIRFPQAHVPVSQSNCQKIGKIRFIVPQQDVRSPKNAKNVPQITSSFEQTIVTQGSVPYFFFLISRP